MQSEPQVGDRMGSFRLLQKLGEGGMGVVFKAEDESLGRFVAVKVLSQSLATDREFTQRFLREAKSVAVLNHPNIIQIHFVGQQGDQYYMAMEFVDGCSFGARVGQRGSLPEREALESIRQAALGLQHALKQGLIHRDIKPDNLLLTSEGNVKIADFGLAKRVVGEQSVALTATMMVVGTPSYMSPEQALGEPLDHRTDIYSLGCTLYYLLTVHTPCEASSVMKVLMNHIQEPPVPIEKYRPETTPAVRQILHRMLAKDRKDRYTTYDELVADIELARETPYQLSPSGQRVTPAGLSRGRRSFWSVRQAILAAEIAVILFLAVSLGYWYWMPPKKDSKVSAADPMPKTNPPPVPAAHPATSTVMPTPPAKSETVSVAAVSPEPAHTPTPAPPVATPDNPKISTTAQTPLSSVAPPLPKPVPAPIPISRPETVIPKPLTPWVEVNLTDYYMADIIATESGSSEDLFSPPDGQLATTSWLKKNAGSLRVGGIPDNGLLEIPKSSPRGFFVIPIGHANALFVSSDKGAHPGPVQIDLSPEHRTRYKQVELLTAGIAGSGNFILTLHYASGLTDPKALEILDQIAPARPQQKAGDPLLVLTTRTTKNLTTGRSTQLYAQTVSLDPRQILNGMTIAFKSFTPMGGGPAGGPPGQQTRPGRPARPSQTGAVAGGEAGGGGASEEHFMAAIFAISALRADR